MGDILHNCDVGGEPKPKVILTIKDCKAPTNAYNETWQVMKACITAMLIMLLVQ